MGSADGVCRTIDERPIREYLEEFLPELRGMGSFDCVVLCFANDNFAQDDRILNGDRC
jgi:hypothetical protein